MVFPLRFFPETTSFNFMKTRLIGFVFSMVLIIGSLGLLATKGLNLGIDFTGGILIEMRSDQPIELAPLRDVLDKKTFGEISLQHLESSNEVLLRIQAQESAEQAKVVEQAKVKIAETIEGVAFRKVDFVGPTVGRELVQSGYLSLGIAFGAILLYIWFRFEWQFGLGAVIALVHDALLTLGFFMVTGFDFGLTSIAAILTVIGYSINDSVVIYDRIRENMRRFKQKPLEEIINKSLNETLSRTILTAGTTILAAGALVLFGGDVIHGFSAALLFGVIIGTYSSIYIAAPVLIYLNVRSVGNDELIDTEAA